MYLNGIMLISAVLDFTTIDFNPNNELPFILFLPGYAATAWYHEDAEVAQATADLAEGSGRICARRICQLPC